MTTILALNIIKLRNERNSPGNDKDELVGEHKTKADLGYNYS